eukprot:PITA_15503
MSELQKAWFYNEYGSIDVLQFGEIPVPKPGPGELLVKIRAAALNPVDFKRRNDLFKNAGPDFPIVPGCDAAGVVVEVGNGVSKFKNGDEVYSDVQNARAAGRPKQRGTLAQYTLVDEYLVAPKPKNLSFEEAASLPLAVLTAQQAFDIAKFEKGKSAFIVGGAGGVGSLAIQLARHVYGASRITYDQIFEKFDFVFDTIGDSSKSHVVAKEDAKVLDIASFQPHGKVEFFRLSAHVQNLEKLQPYIESGKLKPVIDPNSPYSFSDVREAFKHLETRRARGKIVISPID